MSFDDNRLSPHIPWLSFNDPSMRTSDLVLTIFLAILLSHAPFLHQEQMLRDAITLLDTHRGPLSQP